MMQSAKTKHRLKSTVTDATCEEPSLLAPSPQIEDQPIVQLNLSIWLREVFDSPPRRDVMGRCRPTQRFAFQEPGTQDLTVPEGGNEFTAVVLLIYLKQFGIVARFKLQPFNINEIYPGIDATPDLLVELVDGRIFAIEVKARRFISPDVLQKTELNRDTLKTFGIPYLLWTDRDPDGKTDKVNRDVWGNMREIYRGLLIPLDHDSEAAIRQITSKSNCSMRDLLTPEGCGWDLAIAALARGVFYINLQEEINEESTIKTSLSNADWEHFFEEGNAAKTWWDSLPDFSTN